MLKIEADSIRISHIRNRYHGIKCSVFDDAVAFGGITIASTIDDQGRLLMAFAICSVNDVYQRKVGRELATRRLLNGDFITINNNKHWFATEQLFPANGAHQIQRLQGRLATLGIFEGLVSSAMTDEAMHILEDVMRFTAHA